MFRNLSLRYKFLSLIAVLLSTAIFVYLFLAVRLFDEDKTAFIYEGQSTLAATLADQASTRLDALGRVKRILANTAGLAFATAEQRQSALESVIVTDPHIIDFRLYSGNQYQSAVINPNFISTFDVDAKMIANLYSVHPVLTTLTTARYENASNLGDLPIIRITTPIEAEGKTVTAVMHVLVGDMINTFSRSQENTSYLIGEDASVLAHADVKAVNAKLSMGSVGFVQKILASSSSAGAMQTTDEAGVELIVSYAKLGGYPMAVISQIPKWKAFIASTRLKEKSAYFAIMIVIASFMASILFTKTLTSALQRLHGAANEISSGNFDVAVRVKSKDEIGALSRAFNFMAQRILQLMKETADKARMEKELETAQLVQENFFPIDRVDEASVSLSAHFQSASECGGDWWGHLRKPDGRLVVLIGDATGHGVPSALITAAAHSCCTTIQQLLSFHDGDISPAMLMTTLNKTVYAAGKGSVKMTFFVAEIDPVHNLLTYANASHELPVISRQGEEVDIRTKQTLDTLDGEPGNILGESDSSTYQDYTYPLHPGDVLVWYTDGLTECRNASGDEFGENRLIRAVLKHAHQSPEEIKLGLLDKANQFTDSDVLEDDITLVVMRYEGQANTAHQRAS